MSLWPAGIARVVLDAVGSTNDEARQRLAAGDVGPLWIAARRQHAGRGREHRPWFTEPGNLAATLLLPFRGTPAEAARLGFSASLAVGELFDHFAPGVRVSLKWPNDVLLAGRKASGILLENYGSGPDGRLAVAIGVGINLSSHPQSGDLRWPATSIAGETGRAPAFEEALGVLAVRMGRWTGILEGRGFEPVRSAWLARADRVGEIIDARLPRGTLTGRFSAIDADGALVLETADGPRRIAAGEVFFREAG